MRNEFRHLWCSDYDWRGELQSPPHLEVAAKDSLVPPQTHSRYFVASATLLLIMEDLEKLEVLSLVTRVTTELQNHLGVNDKDLAEFIIAQHGECKNFDEFKKTIDGFGVGMSS